MFTCSHVPTHARTHTHPRTHAGRQTIQTRRGPTTHRWGGLKTGEEADGGEGRWAGGRAVGGRVLMANGRGFGPSVTFRPAPRATDGGMIVASPIVHSRRVIACTLGVQQAPMGSHSLRARLSLHTHTRQCTRVYLNLLCALLHLLPEKKRPIPPDFFFFPPALPSRRPS